jgi:hypothetical protein
MMFLVRQAKLSLTIFQICKYIYIYVYMRSSNRISSSCLLLHSDTTQALFVTKSLYPQHHTNSSFFFFLSHLVFRRKKNKNFRSLSFIILKIETFTLQLISFQKFFGTFLLWLSEFIFVFLSGLVGFLSEKNEIPQSIWENFN